MSPLLPTKLNLPLGMVNVVDFQLVPRTSPRDPNAGSTLSSKSLSTMSAAVKSLTTGAIKDNKVMVFSKSYCPYCAKTKATLDGMGIKYGLFELDKMPEGGEVQDFLLELTKQRTVPNVFVNGKHIGGNDATQAAIKDGSFQKALSA
eukprot:gene23404-26495_t